jgi:streptogramin lyase
MSKSKFHFFGASQAEWFTDESAARVIERMETGKRNFSLWYVPAPPEAQYAIDHFEPQVEGRIFLGQYDTKGKRVYPQ